MWLTTTDLLFIMFREINEMSIYSVLKSIDVININTQLVNYRKEHVIIASHYIKTS